MSDTDYLHEWADVAQHLNNMRQRDHVIMNMIQFSTDPRDGAIMDLLRANNESFKLAHGGMDDLLERYQEVQAEVEDKDSILKKEGL